jgi:site-specific DNA recombinase
MIRSNITRAVGYARRSTDMQERSIPDQKAYVERWAGEHGYHVGQWFVDDAVSGTSTKGREAFEKMIVEAENGRDFDAVLCYDISRFSRGGTNETGYYLYRLQQAGVQAVFCSDGIPEGEEGELLQGVKSWQARQYSISLSQNTLRGQISSVMSASDPGRAAPYGYDRQILAPDGSVLFCVRCCPGHVREVYDKDGKLQARYEKGQPMSKPGKGCRARLVLSTADRVQVAKDIFRMCLKGIGFGSIAADLNAKGIPGPVGDLWGFTTVKAILENPTYRGDLVWNRRTEAKFYRVRGGRAQKRQRQAGEARVVRTPKDEWIVVPGAVPAIVSTEDWEKAQTMVVKRQYARGGAGHRDRRWLLTGVLQCGDCGHRLWGMPRRKGRRPGRADVVSNYYICSGRRAHGETVCAVPSTLRAEHIEEWVLDKLGTLVATDEGAIEKVIQRFAERMATRNTADDNADRVIREIKQIDETVAALAMSLDPANLALLNDRLTQLRLRKEALEEELREARRATAGDQDIASMREWAKTQLAGLRDAMNGVRNDYTRNVIASYVERIVVWPSQKRGQMLLNLRSAPLWKGNDRPEGRSWFNLVGARGLEPPTPCTPCKCSSQAELRPDSSSRIIAGRAVEPPAIAWGPLVQR